MSRPILSMSCVVLFAVLLSLAVGAPLRQRRQFDAFMGDSVGNQYDGYGDNDYGMGKTSVVYVSQGNDDITPEQTGYGGYEDFGGYGGFEGPAGNQFL